MNSNEKKTLRKKLYVNRDVQGALILRSVLHWSFYMVAILLVVSIIAVIKDPSRLGFGLLYESFLSFAPAIVASILLLPLFVYDILRSSNRVAGPIVRLQHKMKKLTAGEEIEELRFRDGDHWNEVADEFNALAKQVMKERRAYGRKSVRLAKTDASDSLELVGALVDELE